MTPVQKQTIRTTWQHVGAIGDAAAALFYERLFEVDPSLRPLIAKTEMTAQRGKLLQALVLVVASLDRLETLVPILEQLGRRHVSYGVRKQHYQSVGSALLWTLGRGLGDAWSEEAEEAWSQAYALVSGVMSTADQAENVQAAG